jgi:hypothetical protein
MSTAMAIAGGFCCLGCVLAIAWLLAKPGR